MEEKKNLFTLIPKVDDLLQSPLIEKLSNEVPRVVVVDSIREEVELLRKRIREKKFSEAELKERIDLLPQFIEDRILRKNRYKLRRVVNGTGVVIHTNLGRSLINEEIMKNIIDVATNYSNLEYDLNLGERGSRYSHLEEIIKDITGGESAMVVNNNAAAVLLALSTMAKDREVVVSRGELIEIGGSFRVPDVMAQSGAELVDVGTTNKTHVWDYENAINENTGALLKVHTSNYRILGFTSSVSIEELKVLKDKYDIPLIEDLGSGVLIDLSKYGLEYEPTVQDSIRKGVDIVTFSGDKLLGGPQAGIIVGKKEYIDKMKKNPLTRAFRVDKFTISALESTLRYYLDEEKAVKSISTLNMLTITLDQLESKANSLKEVLCRDVDSDHLEVEVVDDTSEVGGGSLPLEKLPTKCVTLSPKMVSSSQFEKNLRDYEIPIITRVYRDKIYIDLRTVKDSEFEIILNGVLYALEI
ncbi:L-seryl-tRNA(Sec) selenium transferase [Anaerosalibacter sp. Marseille-P3206]|uniref:L-seryl-tRNA(Sec) selenium transferase n=1 Tax=Anaerosalibacter sp. Marseille-P3206 TaxID=1871005 RepID=UPI000984A60C|nr:L-seryl-tRNA(Sec) selenium transferase [Anaerosalibacter sp. Marseille-P3206]